MKFSRDSLIVKWTYLPEIISKEKIPSRENVPSFIAKLVLRNLTICAFLILISPMFPIIWLAEKWENCNLHNRLKKWFDNDCPFVEIN